MNGPALARAGTPPRAVIRFPVSGWSGNDCGAPRPRLGATSDEELALRSHDHGANPRARQPARRPLPLSVRFAVLKRDRFTCAYCGKSPPAVVVEVDHVVPVALGGTNAIGNLVTSCQDCNSGKGARPLADGQARVKRTATAGGEAAGLLRSLFLGLPRKPTVAIVGPSLVYGEGDALSVMVVCGGRGFGEPKIARLELGNLVADPMDDALCAVADTVLQIGRRGDITRREAKARRAAFVAEARLHVERVQDCATERELVVASEYTFPGPKSAKLRATFEAEQRSTANG
jgi:hypothetical protein